MVIGIPRFLVTDLGQVGLLLELQERNGDAEAFRKNGQLAN